MWLNFKSFQNGLTALHLSSKEGNVDIVKAKVDTLEVRVYSLNSPRTNSSTKFERNY